MNLQEVMGRGNRARRKRKFFDDPEKKGAATFSESKHFNNDNVDNLLPKSFKPFKHFNINYVNSNFF